MNAEQLYTVVNSMTQQTTGQTGLQPTHAQFIDNGTTILSSEDNIDTFYKVLLDMVGRTVTAMRAYKSPDDDLKREPIEWGAIFQKISLDLVQAKENTTWNSLNTPASNPFEKSVNTPVQRLFSKVGVWDIDYTVPDVQLRTAFRNEESMIAFLDGLVMSALNSMELAEENNILLCRCAFIARKQALATAHPAGFRNLIAEYQTETGTALTVNVALQTPEFLRFAATAITTASDYMVKMSKTFNDGTITRHTPKEYQVLKVLSMFERKLESNMQSSTYHDELVKLRNYSMVPYWQTSGTDWSWDAVSSVNVDVETEMDGTAVSNQISNVVALLYDRDAMGTSIYNRRDRSIYNPKDEYTNYFMKAEIGYFNDMSENGIVFYLAEPTATATAKSK